MLGPHMQRVLVGLLVAAVAHAEEPAKKDAKDLSLDELLETPVAVASKAQARTARDTPGVVTAMSREEILASGARDLLEVLQLLVPGRHARLSDFVVDALAACAGLAFAAGLDWAIRRVRRPRMGTS